MGGFDNTEERRAKPPQHTEEYRTGVYRCGERRDHIVRIHRANWPPVQHPSLNDRPFVPGVCERCGANVIVYDPIPFDMTVVLYGSKDEARGRIEDEVGAAVAEEELPVAGQVVEEQEPMKKGRR